MRTIGGSIGYAILNNILISQRNKKLPATITANVVKAGLPQNQVRKFLETFLETVATDPKKAAQIPVDHSILVAAAAGYAQGYADSAKYVFYVGIPFGVLAVVMCLLLPNISKLMTNNVVAKTER